MWKKRRWPSETRWSTTHAAGRRSCGSPGCPAIASSSSTSMSVGTRMDASSNARVMTSVEVKARRPAMSCWVIRVSASCTASRVLHVERDDVEQVAGLPGAGARALDDLARTDLPDLLRERPDAVRPAGGERARRHVGPVVEHLQGMRHALPRLGPDAREPLQVAADGLVRHAGQARDVVDRRRLRRAGTGRRAAAIRRLGLAHPMHPDPPPRPPRLRTVGGVGGRDSTGRRRIRRGAHPAPRPTGPTRLRRLDRAVEQRNQLVQGLLEPLRTSRSAPASCTRSPAPSSACGHRRGRRSVMVWCTTAGTPGGTPAACGSSGRPSASENRNSNSSRRGSSTSVYVHALNISGNPSSGAAIETTEVPPTRTSIRAVGHVNPVGPHHRCSSSGSVQDLQASAGAAARSRTATSSSSPGGGASVVMPPTIFPSSADRKAFRRGRGE